MIAPLIAPLTAAEIAQRQARAAYERKTARYIGHMLMASDRGCLCAQGATWCTRGQALMDAADRAYVPRAREVGR